MGLDDSRSVQTAEETIGKLGLPLPRKPDKAGEPEWPKNLGDLSDEDLIHHLTWCKGWSAHARWHLARVEGNLDAFEESYRRRTVELTFKSEGDYRTVTELKASVANAPDVVKIRVKLVEAKVTAKMIRSLLEGYEDKFAAISRELTRRGKDADEDRRTRRFSP